MKDFEKILAHVLNENSNPNDHEFYLLAQALADRTLLPEEVATLKQEAEKAKNQQQACGYFWLAELEHSLKNYTEAIALFEVAIQKGHAGAMNNRAFMHKKRQGGPINYDAAIALFDKAIKKGHTGAMNSRAFMHEEGQGGPINYDAAIALFDKAIKKGDTEAMAYRAFMHEKGQGAPTNYKEAARLYRKAIKQGNSDAYEIFITLSKKNDLATAEKSVINYHLKMTNYFQTKKATNLIKWITNNREPFLNLLLEDEDLSAEEKFNFLEMFKTQIKNWEPLYQNLAEDHRDKLDQILFTKAKEYWSRKQENIQSHEENRRLSWQLVHEIMGIKRGEQAQKTLAEAQKKLHETNLTEAKNHCVSLAKKFPTWGDACYFYTSYYFNLEYSQHENPSQDQNIMAFEKVRKKLEVGLLLGNIDCEEFYFRCLDLIITENNSTEDLKEYSSEAIPDLLQKYQTLMKQKETLNIKEKADQSTLENFLQQYQIHNLAFWAKQVKWGGSSIGDAQEKRYQVPDSIAEIHRVLKQEAKSSSEKLQEISKLLNQKTSQTTLVSYFFGTPETQKFQQQAAAELRSILK